mgnify:FL=1
MWFLLLMLYTNNPVADIAVPFQFGPFKTFETCSSALERAKFEFTGRGLVVKGTCVLQ